MNPPNSETPRTNAATCDSRNGIRSSEGTVVLASFARQLEKELNEANQLHVEDMRLCGKHGCLSYKELEQLLVEKNITANTFMAQVKKLQANETQLTSRLEARERANSEMSRTLCFFSSVIKCGESWSEHCETALRGALSPTSGQAYIPREVPTGTEAEVCSDIIGRQKKGVAKYGVTVAENPLELNEWLNHAYQECLDMAVYLKRAQSYGLGKEKAQ